MTTPNLDTGDAGYRFVFPEVLRGLKWARGVVPADLERVELPDARQVIRWYFAEMTDGARYERAINQP
jgi:hypothetical protein